MYRRELIVNVSFLILANVLIKPYYIFFVERNIQNQVGTEVWGLYFTLFSLSMLPQIVLDMGISSYANQRLSAHRDGLQSLWQDTVWIKPVLALFFIVIFIGTTWIGGYLQKYPMIITWIGINQILLSGILFFRAYISGLGHFRMDSIMSIADKLIFISLFTLGIVVGTIHEIEDFLWLQTISMLIPFVLSFIWIIRRIGISIPKIDFRNTRNIIRDSLPFAGIFILMVLFCRMEPVWINILTSDGDNQAGIYAAAYRLLDAANMMGFLFAGILLPMFSHAMSAKDVKGYQSLFDLAWSLMVSLSVLISFTIASHHRYIMQVLYVDDHPNILHIVMFTLIPLTINYLLSTLITASGKAKVMNYYFLVSIAINIVCHVILTPRFGARGAALTALITQVCTSFLLIYLVEKFDLVKITLSQSKTLFITMSILIALIWLLNLTPLDQGYRLILLFSVASLLLMIFDIIPLKSILSTLKQKSG